MSADRARLLPGWDADRLGAATVVVAGVGAIGNAVAPTLALAGVGRLILCDPDVVEDSNLARCPLFRASDVGQPKALVAARALWAMAPALQVVPRVAPVERGVGLGELASAALVVGGLDSRAARVALAGRVGLVGVPWLDGATGVWVAEVRAYLDADGPCYACGLMPEDRARGDAPWGCGEAPGLPAAAAAPLSAAVGGILGLAAVRFLLGLPVSRQILALDATGAVHELVHTRAADCPFHHRLPAARPVAVTAEDTVGALRAALAPGDVPLAWHPIRRAAVCRSCGHQEAGWGLPTVAPCPRCGAALQPRTTLELADAPPTLRLEALGIPPEEILAVRGAEGIYAVGLAPTR